MDVLDRADLLFPHSLPEFQRLFPDDAACAAYLEKARWGDGFACPHCGTAGEPFHFENRPGVLRCRKCRQNTGLTVGTVMERSHTPRLWCMESRWCDRPFPGWLADPDCVWFRRTDRAIECVDLHGDVGLLGLECASGELAAV